MQEKHEISSCVDVRHVLNLADLLAVQLPYAPESRFRVQVRSSDFRLHPIHRVTPDKPHLRRGGRSANLVPRVCLFSELSFRWCQITGIGRVRLSGVRRQWKTGSVPIGAEQTKDKPRSTSSLQKFAARVDRVHSSFFIY